VSVRASPSPPIELSADPRFARRVRRLGIVSLAGPGLLWWLAATRLALPPPLLTAMLAGWLLMPSVLFASIPLPALRPLLIVPASLITAPVLGIVVWWSPERLIPSLGWALIAVGLLIGAVAGGWFWFRWGPPPPAAFDDPFSPARWGLIALHVGCLAVGFVLAALG
jgi:hypothetical protein